MMNIWLNMPLYSLIVSVSLSLLWIIWRLTGLRHQTCWRFNRAVLLMIAIISLIVGLIPFLLPTNNGIVPTVEINTIAAPVASGENLQPEVVTLNHNADVFVKILSIMIPVYWIGVIASLLTMLIGIISVVRIILMSAPSAKNPKLLIAKSTEIQPFSWGNRVVMTEKDYEENGVVILIHELTHLRYNHWIDILAVNIVKILTWYCPASYAILRELAEMHEFEADNAVISNGYDASTYQLYLVEKAAHRRRFANSLVCSINNPYSQIKNRIFMMQKTKSGRKATLRALVMVPATLLIAFAATSPVLGECIQKEPKPANDTIVNTVKVTEVAITLTDKELMEPRPEEITLPKSNNDIYSKWSRSLIYPGTLAAEGKQGRVLLKVKVNTAGEITDVSVFSSAGYKEFDDAAIKTVTGTTGLTAATYKGNKADINVLIPVTFKKHDGLKLPPIEGNSGFMLDEIVAVTY